MAKVNEVRLLRKEVVLVSRPQGLPKETDFKVIESDLVFMQPPPPGSGEVILKVLWLSVDPYLRALMHADSYLSKTPAFEIGKVNFVACLLCVRVWVPACMCVCARANRFCMDKKYCWL